MSLSKQAESKSEPENEDEPEPSRSDTPTGMGSSTFVEVGETVINAPSMPSPRTSGSTALPSGEVVKHALDLLMTFIIARPELLEQLYEYEKHDGWIERLLLVAPVRRIRQAAANAMLRLSQQIDDEELKNLKTEPPAKHFLQALLSLLPGITSYSNTCQQVHFHLV